MNLRATHLKTLKCLFFAVLVLTNTREPSHAQQPPVSSTTANRYLVALHALGNKDYRRALAESKALILDDPSFPLAYEKVVNAAQRSGELHLAETFFTAQLNPPTNNARGHFGLGLIQRHRGDPAKAFEHHRHCLQAIPDFVPAYIALVDAARVLNRLSEVESFIESLPRTAASRYGLSYLRYCQRLYPQAIALSDEALLIDPHLSESYKTRALSIYASGRYAEARDAIQLLLQTATEPEKIELKLSGMVLAATAAAVSGKRTEGIAELLSVYRDIVEVGNLEMEEIVLSQLAYFYDLQQDCTQSLQYARAVLELGKELKSRYVGRYIGNVGGAYACLGDLTEAVNYYRQALESYADPQNFDASNSVSLLANIAEANLSNSAEALPMLEKALAMSRDINNPIMRMRVLLVLGALYQQHGDHARALERTREALQIAQQTGVAVPEGNSWNQLGQIYLSLSNTVQAMDAHRQALVIGNRTNTPQIIWQALAGLAEVLQKQGKGAMAAEHYRQAIEKIEDVRSRIGIAEDRASFLADKVEIYKKLVSLLVDSQLGNKDQQANASEAFRYTERARARAFFDLLAEGKINFEQDISTDLLKQRQQLQQRISELTILLVNERAPETSKQDKTKIETLEKALARGDVEVADWLRELRRRNPRYAAFKYPEPVTLAGTQQMLDDQTILLSFSLAEPASYVFAISKDNFQVKRLPSEATLARSVQKVLAAITGKTNPDEYRRQAALLSSQLLQPISHLLVNKKALIVVPDGVLHRLPFEMLFAPGTVPRGEMRQWPYLIKRMAISYAPSASVLTELPDEPRRPVKKSFIAFGDPVYNPRAEGAIASTLRAAGAARLNFQPLRYSREEIAGIAKLFADDDRELFLGAAASEQNVKAPDRLSHYRMVHFSTHGYVNETRPRFSGLVLSLPPGGTTAASPQLEDGMLSAYEIFGLKLNADLVVLSACETGLGKEVKGEGLMSLTRSFIYAGTPSVVVSLWNVNDESAADLMIRFYRNHKTGMGKSEALRQAQLETIRDNGFPFFWAPFVLVGKP